MHKLAYRKFCGSFQLVETERGEVLKDGFGNVRILHQCDELAFAFSQSTGTLFKHGDVGFVNRWAQQFRGRMSRHGFEEETEDLVVISSREFDVEMANRIISTAGYILRVWRELPKSSADEHEIPARYPAVSQLHANSVHG